MIIKNKTFQEYNLEKGKKETLHQEIKQKETQKKELESKLKDEKAGAEKVNYFLSNFFGHQNLKLEAIDNNSTQVKFEVTRDGFTAHHLSEGECSLVAFCYFMAKLEDIETQQDSLKPIIFIDDPISSLDSNHIFYVYSLINSELFQKNRF